VLAAAGWQVPAATALTRARRRIGEAPLESLFRRLCSALSPGRSLWSHVGGLLVVAWDGTTVAAGASAENVAAFGKPGTPKRRPPRPGTGADDGTAADDDTAGCPQLRLVTLVACGTRGLLDAAAGPLRGKGTGEQGLARQLLGSLHRGMLLLADRGFYSYGLWTAAAATGADLLWRVSGGMHLPVARELPDGSWLAHVNDPAAVQARHGKNGMRRRRGSALPPDTSPLPGITVRVIEFTVTVATGDGATRTERYRLITTLLDWRRCPAAELAAGYSWRWAIETGFREFKTYLRGPGRRLRGQAPELARQELWAYLCVYQAIRAARRPRHHDHRPGRHDRRAGRDRDRDLVLPGPRARGTGLPTDGETAPLVIPVQEKPRRPRITARHLHHRRHRTQLPHQHQHWPAHATRKPAKPAPLNFLTLGYSRPNATRGTGPPGKPAGGSGRKISCAPAARDGKVHAHPVGAGLVAG